MPLSRSRFRSGVQSRRCRNCAGCDGQPGNTIRDALRLKGIHFTSGTVGRRSTPDHLLLEFSADGDEASTVKTYAECLTVR
jgi:hypothetical protein